MWRGQTCKLHCKLHCKGASGPCADSCVAFGFGVMITVCARTRAACCARLCIDSTETRRLAARSRTHAATEGASPNAFHALHPLHAYRASRHHSLSFAHCRCEGADMPMGSSAHRPNLAPLLTPGASSPHMSDMQAIAGAWRSVHGQTSQPPQPMCGLTIRPFSAVTVMGTSSLMPMMRSGLGVCSYMLQSSSRSHCSHTAVTLYSSFSASKGSTRDAPGLHHLVSAGALALDSPADSMDQQDMTDQLGDDCIPLSLQHLPYDLAMLLHVSGHPGSDGSSCALLPPAVAQPSAADAPRRAIDQARQQPRASCTAHAPDHLPGKVEQEMISSGLLMVEDI